MLKERTDKEIDSIHLNNLFRSIGWKTREKEKWSRVLDKSSFVYSVWEEDLLIGFGRIMEDGVMCMLYDIGVLPRYQRKGIGTKIMKALIDQVKDKKYVSIGLFAWEENPANMPFYKKFGFVSVNSGMELEKYMQRE